MNLRPPNLTIAQISLVCIILSLGVFFRFYSLDHLSYWGDEETSSLPAKSLAQGGGANFPSGMEYRRGLPHTYLMAQTVKSLDNDTDYSYRLPSAVLGSATLFIFFFLVYRFLGFNVALVATILLSFSEWHLLLSRTARMYGPMLLFSVIFYYFIFLWHQKKRPIYIFSSILSILISVSFNFLAILAIPLFFVPLLYRRMNSRHVTISLVASGVVAVTSIAYFRLYVTTPYRAMIPTDPGIQNTSGSNNLIQIAMAQINIETILVALLSLAFTLVTYRRLSAFTIWKNNLIAYMFLFASILGAYLFGLLGHFFATFLFSIFIISISEIRSSAAVSALRIPALILASALIFWTVFYTHEYGATEGIKELFRYPFPYVLYQANVFYGLVLLFFIGLFYSSLKHGEKQKFVRSAGVSYLIVSIFVGLMQDWPPPRYMVTVYPLLIIVSSYGLVCLSDQIQSRFGRRKLLHYILIFFVPACGVLGGHGLPQAMKIVPGEHGMLIYSNHIQGIIYPDHRSLGCFVRNHLKPNDIVVAQDALQQYWYVGRVDYWLRQPDSIDSFLFESNGTLKDFYVLSEPTSDKAINKLKATKERIWVITSGEVYNFKDHFLGVNTAQRDWIDHVEETYTPIVTGLDNASAVYCINCGTVSDNPGIAISGTCSERTY